MQGQGGAGSAVHQFRGVGRRVRELLSQGVGQADGRGGQLGGQLWIGAGGLPGEEAEVDFGELWVRLAGKPTKIYMFALRMSYSGKAVHKVFASQGQEAVPRGIARIDAAEDERRIEGRIRTVGQDFGVEQPLLRPLSAEPFEAGRLLTPKVDRFGLVTVRQSHYSVPAQFIGLRVRVMLRASHLVIYDGRTETELPWHTDVVARAAEVRSRRIGAWVHPTSHDIPDLAQLAKNPAVSANDDPPF